jgi:DNA invertase Pin-like site-specific DNA recombinase
MHDSLAAGDAPIRAAQYVRMSTEHQQYSIENQVEAIASYAKANAMEVIRTYTDGGRSGLTIRRREGLRQLLQDVESGRPEYSAILVYDISRWGRFQDADESAFYEYRCKQANIRVHYCAEPFANDGSISSTLLKTIKRTMAAEFSRELSVKSFAGKCRLVEYGFRQGGAAGFGLRRLLVDQDGKPKFVLRRGEQKSLLTDRVILIPGPPREIRIVREIYRRFIEGCESMPAITQLLNERGILSEHGRPWTRAMVSTILTNPKYMGTNVTNRLSFKLKAKRVSNPPEMWVRRDGAFEPLVSAATFNKAQEVLVARNKCYTDDELLDMLRRLQAQKGKLSHALIDQAPGFPTARTFADRFGGILGAYRRIGYATRTDFDHQFAATQAMRACHQQCIADLIADLSNIGAAVDRDSDNLLTINDEVRILYLTFRCCGSEHSCFRWFLRFQRTPAHDLSVAARLNHRNNAVLDYYVVPYSHIPKSSYYNGGDNHPLNLFRFADLAVVKALVRRTQIKEYP